MDNLENKSYDRPDVLTGRELNELENRLFNIADRAVDSFLTKHDLMTANELANHKGKKEIVMEKSHQSLKDKSGSYNFFDDKIRLRSAANKLKFLESCIHELIHQKGSIIICRDGQPVAKTSGLSLHSKPMDRFFLINFNEALTEKITIEIYRTLLREKSPALELFCGSELKEQAEQQKKYPFLYRPDTITVQFFNQTGNRSEYVVDHFGYVEERQYLDAIIDRLAAGTAMSREEIEKKFYQAAFKPLEHTQKLADLMDGVFSAGFSRKLAEIDSGYEAFGKVKEYLDGFGLKPGNK